MATTRASSSSRSTVSADSYVGSFISLISKSEIRYEGVLFTVNPDESSIGLRNVRSFGMEGRRKDGPQVPPSDKIYEYIMFRGSDIKDLQVKSSPAVQTASHIHNDPAIIQSQFTAPTAPSNFSIATPSFPFTSAPPAATSLPDCSNLISHPGLPSSSYQNSVPLSQPGGGSASWKPSAPPTTNASVLWQGYYGPSGALQTQQQPSVRQMQGFPMPPLVQPPSVHHPVPYPTNISASQTEFSPPLLKPIASSAIDMSSVVLPDQSSVLVSDSSTIVMPSVVPGLVPAVSQISNLSSLPALPNMSDKSTAASLIPNQATFMSTSPLPFNNLSEPLSTVGETSSLPTLVAPGQFLQPETTIPQTSQTDQKDVGVVQVPLVSEPQVMSAAAAAAVATTATVSVSSEALAPLLPLPSSSNPQFARPGANFTEEFNFEAMNEKFKKDEVWGNLGTKTKTKNVPHLPDEDQFDHPRNDAKSVYKKDEFFDKLSCKALDRESRNGRPRFYEQMRLDTETFGDSARNQGYQGDRGGWSYGGYYGRGYGYNGRGRGRSRYRP